MRNASSIWYTTSSYSNTSVFFRPHVNEKPAFSKISTLERVFEKMRFGWPFSSDTCGRYAKADEKNLRFQAKRDTCGRGLNFVQHMFFYSSWVFQPSQDDPEDDYRTGCRNVSHCQQQSYLGLRSPGRSHSTYSSYILPYVRGRVSYCLSRRNFIFQAKGPQWPGSMVRGVNSDLQRVRQQAFWRWF